MRWRRLSAFILVCGRVTSEALLASPANFFQRQTTSHVLSELYSGLGKVCSLQPLARRGQDLVLNQGTWGQPLHALVVFVCVEPEEHRTTGIHQLVDLTDNP